MTGRREEKPSHLSQAAWDAVDVPEATDAEFAEARPFRDVFPAAYEDWKKGDPARAAGQKVRIGLRLAPDVANAVRASGKNYNAKVEAILRSAMQNGKL